MILKAFSVYDSKALCYGVPFFMSSTGAAVRAFSDLVNDSQSTVYRHPGDFVLYQIGLFDDSVGKLEVVSPQLQLGIGLDFKVVTGSQKVMETFDRLSKDPSKMLTVEDSDKFLFGNGGK